MDNFLGSDGMDCVPKCYKLCASFHAANRVINSPLSYLIEVSASVLGVEFRPGKGITRLEVESEYTNVGVAL